VVKGCVCRGVVDGPTRAARGTRMVLHMDLCDTCVCTCVYVCFKRTLHVMAWRLLRHGSEADPQKLQKPRRIRLVARADFLPAHLNWHCGHAYTHSHSRHMRKRGDTQGHTHPVGKTPQEDLGSKPQTPRV